MKWNYIGARAVRDAAGVEAVRTPRGRRNGAFMPEPYLTEFGNQIAHRARN
jgi:hypothetical protein